MAARRTNVLDVREIVRRLKLGQSEREIAAELGTSRKTIVKYRKVALEEGWLAQANLPSLGEVELKLAARKPNAIGFGPESTVEPHREKVAKLYHAGVEMMAICVLSIVDNHTFRRLIYEVLDHDPTKLDIERFLARFKGELDRRGLSLKGATTAVSVERAVAITSAAL